MRDYILITGVSIIEHRFGRKTAQGRRTWEREDEGETKREKDNSSRPALESASRAARGRARSFHLCLSLGCWTPVFVHPRCHSLSPVSDVQSHPRLAHGAHSARLRTSTRAGNAAVKGTVPYARTTDWQLARKKVPRGSDKDTKIRETSRMRLLAVTLGFLLQAWIVSCGVRDKTGRWQSWSRIWGERLERAIIFPWKQKLKISEEIWQKFIIFFYNYSKITISDRIFQELNETR